MAARGLKKKVGRAVVAKRGKGSGTTGGRSLAHAQGTETGITIEGIPFALPEVTATEKKRAAALLDAAVEWLWARRLPDGHGRHPGTKPGDGPQYLPEQEAECRQTD